MPALASVSLARLRTLLVLGRVSNLPTVWSNCLAGWLLGGGGHLSTLLWLCLGATCLYLGGTYLNDAADVQFDQEHRRDRPIPSGQIHVETVWKWGLSWLTLGILCFTIFRMSTVLLAVLLALTIFIYNSIHKMFAFSPVFMAGCRLLLVLLAASVGAHGLDGLSLWSALVMGAYIGGLSYFARQESLKTPVAYWPCLFLAAPLVLALVVNRGPYQVGGVLLCGLLLVWTLNCLRHTFWSEPRDIGRTVGGLLAGIVLVDLLAVCGGGWLAGLTFAGLFALALVLQRLIPAT